MSFFSKVTVKSFWITISFIFLICLGYYCNVLLKTNGYYVYLIDDAYIHLSIAKNFALYDVWGITKYKFSSTSSAPLFTYILSVLINLFGDNDQLPLYFNIICGIGVIYFLNKYFSGFFSSTKNIVISVLFTFFFAVLHVQILIGMEHIFHVLLFVLNIYCLLNFKNKLSILGFYLSILLMGVVRFESMFYFAILAFVFTLIKKWREAFLTLIVGFIPIAIFCYFNYQHDGFLFPNSVLVKGTKFTFDSNLPHQVKSILLDNFLFNISFYKIGFFPIIICIIFILRDFKKKSLQDLIKDNFLLIDISLLMICHSMFADLKGSFRYEAYILMGFSMALIPRIKGLFDNFKDYVKKEKLISILVLMNVILLVYKLFYSNMILNNGGKNIYEQQIQSARFLHTYYNNAKVVANDIGAITYFSDIHLFDIAGLGSIEMIPFNENKKQFDLKFENYLTQYCNDNKYDIAVIYEDWMNGYVPKNWKKAVDLEIQDRATAGRTKVSIYSINPNNFQTLKQNIKNFNWNKNVQVTIVD